MEILTLYVLVEMNYSIILIYVTEIEEKRQGVGEEKNLTVFQTLTKTRSVCHRE